MNERERAASEPAGGERPGVAVIIPAYRAAATIRFALASVQKQTVEPAEVVVVDDGSDDDTAEFVERAGFRCIRQDNAGPGAARNAGIAATAAPLVAFLDADDAWLPEKLERQIDDMLERDLVASWTDAYLCIDNLRMPRRKVSKDTPKLIDFHGLLAANPVICSTVLARRDAVVEVGGFDPDRELIATEDYDLWLRLVRQGRFGYLAEPLAEYRSDAAGLSDDERFTRGIDRIMAMVDSRWGDEPDVRPAIRRRRAQIRRHWAWHLADQGDGPSAREVLREARSLDRWRKGDLKLWLKTWVQG